MEQGEDPEPRGTGDFASAPDDSSAGIWVGEFLTKPVRCLRLHRLASICNKGVKLNDSSTVSSESPDSDSSSRDGSDASSSDDGTRTSTMVRTASHQLGAHMSGPGDDEVIREGRTRAQTRTLDRGSGCGANRRDRTL